MKVKRSNTWIQYMECVNSEENFLLDMSVFLSLPNLYSGGKILLFKSSSIDQTEPFGSAILDG
jgi:hypothetical protein